MLCLAVLALSLQAMPAPGRFAYVSGRNVYLWQGSTKPKLLVANASFPSLSPDGKHLAFERKNSVWIRDLGSGREEQVTGQVQGTNEQIPRIHGEVGFQPVWTKDGKALLFAVPDHVRIARERSTASTAWGEYPSQMEIWSIYRIPSTLTAQRKLSTHRRLPPFPKDLLFGPNTGGVSNFEIASTACPAVSPDGRKIAFCRGGDLWLAILREESWSEITPGPVWDESRIWSNDVQEGGTHADNYTPFIFRISWSPTGRKLAVSSQRIGGGGNNDVTILSPEEPAKTIGWFEGRHAAFLDENSLIYSAPDGTEVLHRSLNDRHPSVLLEKGDWPIPFP